MKKKFRKLQKHLSNFLNWGGGHNKLKWLVKIEISEIDPPPLLLRSGEYSLTTFCFLFVRWMPVYMASLGILFYLPYIAFRIVNADLINLKVRIIFQPIFAVAPPPSDFPLNKTWAKSFEKLTLRSISLRKSPEYTVGSIEFSEITLTKCLCPTNL